MLDDRAEYEQVVEELVTAGIIPDASFLYWYLRPSLRHGTLECRVLDTPLRVADTVALAGLVRALAWRYAAEGCAGSAISASTGGERARAAHPTGRRGPRRHLLQAAMWQAARYGVDDELLHPGTGRSAPAAEVVEALLEEAQPGLAHHGDVERVTTTVRRIISEGNGATMHRRHREAGTDPLDLVRRMLVEGDTAT